MVKTGEFAASDENLPLNYVLAYRTDGGGEVNYVAEENGTMWEVSWLVGAHRGVIAELKAMIPSAARRRAQKRETHSGRVYARYWEPLGKLDNIDY